MKGRYEIRIFNERYNVSYNYYMGDKDIKFSVWCGTPEELISKWNEVLKTQEGETYVIWDHTINDIIIGGSLDPSDIDWIHDYFFGWEDEEGDR